MLPGTAQAATITNAAGPLTSVNIGTDLGCQVNYLGDSHAEWDTGGKCGTFLSLGATTYRPSSTSGQVFGTNFTTVSQSSVTGSGTTASPWQIVTVVKAGSNATLTQTDKYVSGDDFYTTDLRVANNSFGTLSGTAWTAGDCYVADSHTGYGRIDGTTPSCTATQAANSRAISLIPNTTGNRYEYNTPTNIWSKISYHTNLDNRCNSCTSKIDNAVAISYPVSIARNGSQSFSWTTAFGPIGGAPLAVSATAHSDTAPAGTTDGYRVQVANPSPTSKTVTAIMVTLPAGFSYKAGTTTGVTTSNPSVSGQVLTWTGTFPVSSGGIVTIDFDVTVSATTGTYTIDATATSSHAVTPVTGTAPITVTPLADLSLRKTASVSAAAPGETFTYTFALHNAGPSGVPSSTVTDTLPSQLHFVSGPGCSAKGQVVTCATGAVAAGGDAGVTVTVRVNANATLGTVTNNAVVRSAVADPDDTNDSAAASVLIRHTVALTITKLAFPSTVTAGSDVTFTITVGNTGTGPATATLADSLPPGLTAVTLIGTGCTLATLACVLPVAAGAHHTITLVARAADNLASGTVLTNTALVNAPDNAVPAGVSATASVTVHTSAHLSLTKTLISGLRAGETGSYRISVHNAGPSRATGVTVTDTLPAGVTFNPAASTSGCSGTTTITCSVGTIPVGGSPVVTIAVNVPASMAAGTRLTNSASAAGGQPNPIPGDATKSVTSTVSRLADLVLSKVGAPDPVIAGTAITYTLSLVNNGPSDAGGVTVTDPMGAGVTVTGATVTTGSGTCTPGATVSCSLGTVAAGAPATVITITGTVGAGAAGSILANTATVTSADPVKDTATTTATSHVNVTATTGLSASKTASANPVAAGAPLDYTLSVTNQGPSTSTHVALHDPVPSGYTPATATASNGATCTIAAGFLDCPDLGTLAVSGSVSVTVAGKVDASQAAGTITNTATFTDAEGGSSQAHDQVTVYVDTDITVTKTSSQSSVTAGSTATWTISVHNAGPSDATDVPIIELADPDFTVTGFSPGATCNTKSIPCVIPSIPAGRTVSVDVTGTVAPDAPAGPISNCAIYSSPVGSARDSNGCHTLTATQLATLTLTKNARPATDEQPGKNGQPATIIAGRRVSFELTVGNDGPSTATGAQVTDTLPAGLTFASEGSSAGCTATGQVVTCPVGTLSPTSTATVYVVATTDPAGSGTVTNTASATATDAPAAAHASADVTETPRADLAILKTAGRVFAGQDLTWHIEVGNAGPSTATGAVIDSTVPAGLTFASATTSSGTCAYQAAARLLVCHPGPIADGGIVSVTLVTHTPGDLVPAGKPYVIVTDPATVAYTGDPSPQNNVAIADAVVFPIVRLQVTKTVSPTPLVAGALATFHGTVKNTGPSVATSVTYTDTLPSGLPFDAAASDHRCAALGNKVGGTQIACVAATLNPGASTTFTVVARVDPALGAGSVLTNDARATAAQSVLSPLAGAQVDAEVTRHVNLVVTKKASAKRAAAGSLFTYTIRVVNRGPSAASNVIISDQAHTSLLYARLSPGSRTGLTCSRGGVSFRCTVPQLMPGATVTIVVDVTTPESTPNGTRACDTARVSSSEHDTHPADNHATACTTITRMIVPVTG